MVFKKKFCFFKVSWNYQIIRAKHQSLTHPSVQAWCFMTTNTMMIQLQAWCFNDWKHLVTNWFRSWQHAATKSLTVNWKTHNPLLETGALYRFFRKYWFKTVVLLFSYINHIECIQFSNFLSRSHLQQPYHLLGLVRIPFFWASKLR